MDSEQFLNHLDENKFSELETDESLFESTTKCTFKAKTTGKVKYVIIASSWDRILEALPDRLKHKVF